MEEHINVAITAFNSCEETNAARFAQAVEGALLDMRVLLEDTAATAEQWSCSLEQRFRPARLQTGQQEVTRFDKVVVRMCWRMLDMWLEGRRNENLSILSGLYLSILV